MGTLYSYQTTRIVQLALLHAEFEALHPYEDGNGRLGRVFVPLFLWQMGFIRRPMFYISAYLEANHEQYIERLRAVSRDDDWTGWCRFFLEAVQGQAEDNLTKAMDIHGLYKSMLEQLPELTRSRYAVRALQWIFEKPIFTSSDFVAAAGIPAPTARRFINVLRDGGVLEIFIEGSGRRPAVYAFSKLLNIAE